MKTTRLLAILLLLAIVCGCLKNEELPPPTITVSQGADEILYFSTAQPATVRVHIESGNELRKFATFTNPMSSWSDTTVVFDPLTHRADFELTFSFWKGFKLPPDSTFVVAYYAYTDDTLSVVRRTMRYKKLYPQLDSFDIKVESSPMGKCLIDVENRCAYKYNEYSNQYFDLVYVNELESDFRFGTGLVSPNAVYLMRYFQRRFPSLPYDPAKRRSTECGLISNTVNKTYSWLDFSNEMLGDNDNWVTYDRIGALPPQDGVGIIDLQMDKLMKFRLESGDLIMVRVLERNSLESADNSSVKLRIYYQK